MKTLPKLHEVTSKDSLRPVMTYIYVDKAITKATDAHALIQLQTESIFNPDFIDKIEVPILISAPDWKKMSAKGVNFIRYNDMIEVGNRSGSIDYIKPQKESDIGTYPRFDGIIPEQNGEEVNKVGVNPQLLEKIRKALDAKGLSLEFTGNGRAIIVNPLESEFNCKAICMPMCLD